MTPDTSAVQEELQRQRNEVPPTDVGSGGCALATVSIIALVCMPFVGRGLDLSGNTMGGMGVALALIALVSGVVGIFGGPAGNSVTTAIEQAVETLGAEYPNGSEDRCLEAAIRILDGAYLTAGPRRVATFDQEHLRERLGQAMEYVEQVERVLRERGEIDPVFTREPSDGPAGELP